MGGVDITNQLRGVYQIDWFIRNRKFWWSMLFWSIGVLLTNAYKVYLQVCDEENVTPQYKQQYDFRKAIAEYWIDPELIEKETFQGAMLNRFESPSASMMSSSMMSPITNPDFDSVTASTKNYSLKSVKVSDSSLNAKNGALRCRLDRTLDHLPTNTSNDLSRECALHGWAVGPKGGSGSRKKTYMRCATCNVHLCTDCYADFHRIPELLSLKTQYSNKYSQEKKRNR